MKIKQSYIVAATISVLIVGWFLVGGTKGLSGKKDKPSSENVAEQSSEATRPSVQVQTIFSEPHTSYLSLHGRTEAVREVSVKAETAGLVVKTPLSEGRYVKKNTLMCAQDIDARQAMLDQAKALLRSRELEYEAALVLVDKGYRSSTQAAGALASLDGARASVTQAKIEVDNVNMRAPFSGIFERQIAEVGDYLAPGQPCGLLVDLDPLIIAGDATEKQIGLLKRGQRTEVVLATGETVSGKVRLIESKANAATRTFRIEIEVPNKDRKLRAGVTANIKLVAGQEQAHLIPANVMALDEHGRVGVKHLDNLQKVQFSYVVTIDETPEGLWVTGLPVRTTLIVRGQDYVSAGIEVRTQYDDPQDTETGTP